MVAGEVESSCQLVVTFFFFFLVSPYQTIEISLGQLSGGPPPSYQLLPPPLPATIYYSGHLIPIILYFGYISCI